ncbi:Cro/Cl-type HTH domain-containing protein [Clostridium sporogenes]|nr:Cro/Cl-type HTH domain-containing protein [Clostridium sporogenes]KRU26076.1 Cro/Cl-type HTH domain-containing protein [Clostridium sporogenes]KRU27132.1 Cro/Cl-type HTH domain-containing protein [Clostridium sporogenes]KRU48992.1 Cro/Cl-type HTH domain-containing protein [Clostridium sporogenes]OQP90637.1 Cro/Cl-type HTH domain-containing protein [Clostridium sporogenes]
MCDRPKGDVILAILKTNIKEYREKTNMKQIDLAEKIGVRRETIVHLENGRYNPSLKMAMDIAKVFNATVEELFKFED